MREASRRTFVTTGLTGIAAAASGALVTSPTAKGEVALETKREKDGAFDTRTKLRSISSRAKQLWPVIYVEKENTLDLVERDVEAALEGGADAVILELGKEPSILARATEHVRRKYPTAKVGVNYLGGETVDRYGFQNSFRIARELELSIVWVDFSGVDLIEELPEVSLHEIEAQRAKGAFYVSGIHMKYGTLRDPTKTIEQSALQAIGWVEGIVVTGPRTGVPTDPERVRRARAAVGAYPLGVASGVSAENFPLLRDSIDYCLVNSSIADENHRLVVAKVRELREVMA